MATGGGASGGAPALPRDAQLMISLLHQMNIQDWEPRVINQLLEYTFRASLRPPVPTPLLQLVWPRLTRSRHGCSSRAGYVSEVGADAEVYKRHAGKQQLDADDIRVAIKLKDTQIMRPPDRDVRNRALLYFPCLSMPVAAKTDSVLTTVPIRQELIALAAERNKEPLPDVQSQHEHGIRLPPPEQQLTAVNYRIAKKKNKRPLSGAQGGGGQRLRPQ
jgi:transcription initiation factor TFIID subunit 9B